MISFNDFLKPAQLQHLLEIPACAPTLIEEHQTGSMTHLSDYLIQRQSPSYSGKNTAKNNTLPPLLTSKQRLELLSVRSAA